MEKHILSKSTFIKGHQCLKSLYLHKKRPFLRDKISVEQLAKFKRGHQVGDLAQKLFPRGIDVSPKSPSQYQKSVVLTQELIAEGKTIIYEATFQFNKVLIMLDILVKTEKGWEAYEVKSSRSLSETYFTDAALQYYVIMQSGLNLASFSLVYVNENYVLENEGEIDVDSFFIKQEVSSELENMQSQIAEEIENELLILNENHSPTIEVGTQCFDPYPCDFHGFCWKNKSTNLFEIPAISETEGIDLLNRGILSINDLKNQNWNSPLVEKQIESLISNKPFVSKDLKSMLDKLPKSTLYLGFVISQSAIPQCVGYKPYQKQMFVYSIVSDDDIKTELFSGICTNYYSFVKLMIDELNSASQIIVYDKDNLANVLILCGEMFPNLKTQIEQLISKTFGIKQWILEGEFYFPKIKHDLIINDVVNKVLNSNSFGKQSVFADVIAINKFQQILDKRKQNIASIDDETAINNYTKSIAEYSMKIVRVLMDN